MKSFCFERSDSTKSERKSGSKSGGKKNDLFWANEHLFEVHELKNYVVDLKKMSCQGRGAVCVHTMFPKPHLLDYSGYVVVVVTSCQCRDK